MGQQELCRDNDVVEDLEVTAEAVAGAELRQRQMHLVHTEIQRRETAAIEDAARVHRQVNSKTGVMAESKKKG